MDFQSIALPTELPVRIFHNLTSVAKLSYLKNSGSHPFYGIRIIFTIYPLLGGILNSSANLTALCLQYLEELEQKSRRTSAGLKSYVKLPDFFQKVKE
jgi:hypothetical protein